MNNAYRMNRENQFVTDEIEIEEANLKHIEAIKHPLAQWIWAQFDDGLIVSDRAIIKHARRLHEQMTMGQDAGQINPTKEWVTSFKEQFFFFSKKKPEVDKVKNMQNRIQSINSKRNYSEMTGEDSTNAKIKTPLKPNENDNIQQISQTNSQNEEILQDESKNFNNEFFNSIKPHLMNLEIYTGVSIFSKIHDL